jgi:hypothetical protein
VEQIMGPETGIGIAGFALYLAAIAVALRQMRVLSPACITVAAALLAYVCILFLAAVSSVRANFWILSVIFWFPTLVFLMGFGAVYKSVSLRMLLDLRQRPLHTGMRSAILAGYVAESFERRLEVMRENRLAVRGPAGYMLTGRGAALAAVIIALQRLFAIERSG